MSTTQTTHTQTPWAIDSELPPNARSIIARVGGIGISGNTEGPHEETDLANAAHIVCCVNMHEGLVAALELARSVGLGGYLTRDCLDKIDAALAKAEGRQP